MNKPLISCIVPVFNGERYLREAVDSILAQTYRPLEIVVADDGSSDDTLAVVARYGKHVRYLSQPNSGPAAARNFGLRAALGDFVAFLDADDLWHPKKLTRQMARLRKRPGIDLCFTRYKHFWMPELAEEERRYRDNPLSRPQSAWHIGTLLAHRVATQRSPCYARQPDQGSPSWPGIARPDDGPAGPSARRLRAAPTGDGGPLARRGARVRVPGLAR